MTDRLSLSAANNATATALMIAAAAIAQLDDRGCTVLAIEISGGARPRLRVDRVPSVAVSAHGVRTATFASGRRVVTTTSVATFHGCVLTCEVQS